MKSSQTSWEGFQEDGGLEEPQGETVDWFVPRGARADGWQQRQPGLAHPQAL